jgi:hypothetical protein
MTFIKEFSGYYFENKKLYSKFGREIKLTLLNYTKGYWLNKKFITLNKLKNLSFYKKLYCPF